MSKPTPIDAEELDEIDPVRPRLYDPDNPDHVRDLYEHATFRRPDHSGWQGPDD